MDEEDLLHAIHERVTHDDLRERDARAPRLDAPANALRREAVLDRAVDRVDEPRHRLGDCLADRGAEDREDRGGDLARVASHRFADRVLDGGRERDPELSVTRRALHDRLRQLFRELLGGELRGVEAAAELVDLASLRAEQEIAKLAEL